MQFLAVGHNENTCENLFNFYSAVGPSCFKVSGWKPETVGHYKGYKMLTTKKSFSEVRIIDCFIFLHCSFMQRNQVQQNCIAQKKMVTQRGVCGDCQRH